MFRRETFVELGGYTLDKKFQTVQDLDLWCRMLFNGYLIANIKQMLIKYRVNPFGITQRRNEEMKLATELVWGKFKHRNMPKFPFKAVKENPKT